MPESNSSQGFNELVERPPEPSDPTHSVKGLDPSGLDQPFGIYAFQNMKDFFLFLDSLPPENGFRKGFEGEEPPRE